MNDFRLISNSIGGKWNLRWPDRHFRSVFLFASFVCRKMLGIPIAGAVPGSLRDGANQKKEFRSRRGRRHARQDRKKPHQFPAKLNANVSAGKAAGAYCSWSS